MLKLEYRDIVLRDLIPSDIDNHWRWWISETEWMKWDAPWEANCPEFAGKYMDKLTKKLTSPPPAIRSLLQICTADGAHIGTVNAYYYNKVFGLKAVGIAIRDSRFWGRGLGEQAFTLWLAYNFCHTDTLYCETWSGNKRMIRLAEKLGFQEIRRDKEVHNWQENSYDAVKLCLHKERFEEGYQTLLLYCTKVC